MRILTADFKTEAYKQQNPQVYAVLLKIDYDGNPGEPLYFVNNYTAITCDAIEYTPLAFNFIMPQDGKENRNASIELDGTDRSVSTFLLSAANESITIIEKLVDISDSEDVVVEITREYILKNALITRTSVSGELSYMHNLQDAFPKLRKVPSKFPGVF